MLFIWALVVILKQGITFLIDMIKYPLFEKIESGLSELSRYKVCEGLTLLPPLSDELVLGQSCGDFSK
jgi:hypothetical protein